MVKLFKSFLGWFPRSFGKLKEIAGKASVKIDGIFETVFGASSTLIKIVFIFQAFLSLISFVVSAILLVKNIDTVVDLMRGVYEGNSFWLDKLAKIFADYTSFDAVVTDMDAAMSSTAGAQFFEPTLTFSGILQTFGIGDAFNAIITCALQGIGFVISMRLFMWSMGRIKLSVTRPLG